MNYFDENVGTCNAKLLDEVMNKSACKYANLKASLYYDKHLNYNLDTLLSNKKIF